MKSTVKQALAALGMALLTASCQPYQPPVLYPIQPPVGNPMPATIPQQVIAPVPVKGQFRVIVLDADGQFLNGATITATCLDAAQCTYEESKTVAGESLQFSGVPANQTVALQARAPGYEPTDRTLPVKAGPNEDQVFKLVKSAS
jgi:hypothetical protein